MRCLLCGQTWMATDAGRWRGLQQQVMPSSLPLKTVRAFLMSGSPQAKKTGQEKGKKKTCVDAFLGAYVSGRRDGVVGVAKHLQRASEESHGMPSPEAARKCRGASPFHLPQVLAGRWAADGSVAGSGTLP